MEKKMSEVQELIMALGKIDWTVVDIRPEVEGRSAKGLTSWTNQVIFEGDNNGVITRLSESFDILPPVIIGDKVKLKFGGPIESRGSDFFTTVHCGIEIPGKEMVQLDK